MSVDLSNRPRFPRRAIVTAGMPYGNKGLHVGHIGGVFVSADFFARFLRDRIGQENVLFISGTDCYGSPIMEGFRTRVKDEGYAGSISDYVRENHDAQREALDAYDISLDLYSGSGLEPAKGIHKRLTAEVITRLYERGHLRRMSTRQFFDAQAGQFLNGRQVMGHCPVRGCKSEKAYADECDLGHQFDPEELISPVSQLTGTTPELRPVENWYFDLPAFKGALESLMDEWDVDPQVRPVVTKTVRESLAAPVMYVQTKYRVAFDAAAQQLPAHTLREAAKGQQSFSVTFSSWQDRDTAREGLEGAGVRFCPSASRATSTGAYPRQRLRAWQVSPSGAGPSRSGRPSASPKRHSPHQSRVATRVVTGRTGGAQMTPRSTSSLAKTTSTSTVSRSRRSGRRSDGTSLRTRPSPTTTCCS